MSTTSTPTDGFEERLLVALRTIVAQRALDGADSPAPANARGRRRARSVVGRPGRRRSRPWLVGGAVAAVCACGAVGGLALAGSLSDTAINPQAWVDGQRVAPAQAVAPDQAAVLGILSRPRVPSDALPADQAQTLTGSPAAANGANPDLSRRAQGFTQGAAWVIPGDGSICLLFALPPDLGGGTCQSDAIAASGQWPVITTMSGRDPGETGLAGIVPNGVTQVTLHLAGGATQTAPVYENVYMTTVDGGLASVTYQGPDGPVTLGA